MSPVTTERPLGDRARAHLIAQGLGRHPATPAPDWEPNLTPLWVDLEQGVPAPGDLKPPNLGTDSVIGINTTPGVPSREHETELRVDALEFVIRARTRPRVGALYSALRREFDDRRGWVLDGLWMSLTKEFRALQPSAQGGGVYTYTTEYTFEFRSYDLA